VIDDIKFKSLRNEVNNMAFVFNDKMWQTFSYIRIRAGAHIKQAVSHIEKSVLELDPSYPVKTEFYDEIFNAKYKQEMDTETTISLFSLLAIIISIVGVFGLVMFECEFKRKEISIRKTLGSTELEVVVLFNKIYLRIFFVCFILSVPVSYYIVKRWLENFAYKTSMDWWGFALVGLLVLIIIVCTVSWQSWRAASANPAKAIKSE
jgi:putative ABC transport system permease protein